jgi:polyisoprenyl-phosphate glycosyltransferase
LLCLGLLGEYLGRLYASAQGRPAYFVGYDSAEDSAPVDSASVDDVEAPRTTVR